HQRNESEHWRRSSMFRETGYAPAQLYRRLANFPDCDRGRGLSFEWQANAATATRAEIRLLGLERAGVQPLAISCSQSLAGNHWVHRGDPPGVGRFDGAPAARESKCARHPTKNPR